MKIAIIGPTCPYRGGISHYNTVFCQNLAEKHEIDAISFKRLYPKKLFPGRDQRDLNSKEKISVHATELVDSINPITWFKTAKRVKKFNPDVVLMYWWTPYFTFNFLTISYLVRKWTKSKIVFLCHNVAPHDARFVDRILTKIGLSQANKFIVHANAEKELLLDIFPDAKVVKNVHPTYEVFKSKDKKKDLGLKLREKVLLFFGFVREYKGLKYLLKALPKILEKYPELDLLIVGEFWDEKKEYTDLIKKLGVEDHVKIIDDYVPNEEVGSYFAVSDVCVLPYVSATNSGIIQTSFGFKKPVIVTNVGGLPEVVLDGQTGFIIPSKSPEAIVKSVVRFYEEGKSEEFKKGIEEDKDRFSWDRMREVLERLTE